MSDDSCRYSFTINDDGDREFCGMPAIACDTDSENPVCVEHTQEAWIATEKKMRKEYDLWNGSAACRNSRIAAMKIRPYSEEPLPCLDLDNCKDQSTLTEVGHHDGCCCYECVCYYYSLK